MTWAPWSNAATSNADRVRVDVFSKISAISLPSRRFASVPAYLAIFSASDELQEEPQLLRLEVDLLEEAAVAQVQHSTGPPSERLAPRGGM